MIGQIININSDLHSVLCDGVIYPCKCRGKFRYEKILPLVGDNVSFDKDKLLIEKIMPRKNYFDRPKVSNIDIAFIVTSLVEPDLDLVLLDKFLVLMELHNVEAVICITKSDICSKNYDNIFKYYQDIGYRVIYNYEVDKIKNIISNKTVCFVGQTGAGKSSLINRLDPNFNIEVGEISRVLGRGKHTTRSVTLYNFFDGKLLDTPGFSSLDFNKSDLSRIKDSFIEFSNYTCLYGDCSHTKEGECLVKKGVLDNKILKSRYDNYLYFIGGVNEKN